MDRVSVDGSASLAAHDDEVNQNRTTDNETNSKMGHEVVNGKRGRTNEKNISYINSMASLPSYNNEYSQTHILSQVENLHRFKRPRNSPFQLDMHTDGSNLMVNGGNKLIGTQNSLGNASLSLSNQGISNIFSRETEHRFFEENLSELISNRANSYMIPPQTLQTQFTTQHLAAQTSLLEKMYNRANNVRNTDETVLRGMLENSKDISNNVFPLTGQSIISRRAYLLENEERRHHEALQDIKRLHASRAGFDDLRTELRLSANRHRIENQREETHRGNQEFDRYFLANSAARHGSHNFPIHENHLSLASAGSATSASDALLSTVINESSLVKPELPFIHQLQGTKYFPFSGRSFLENNASSAKRFKSHPSNQESSHQAKTTTQSYGTELSRQKQDGTDTDHTARRNGSHHELPHHFRGRPFVALGTIEDEIWLSPFLCFLRSQCIEIFRAKEVDVSYRRSAKTKIELHQVGIRCRFCAHKPYQNRGKRSSSFPSSVSRIYQSVTMMIREHFHICMEFPEEVRRRYCALKRETTKGELESKRYWAQSAVKLGMTDTPSGIFFTSEAQTAQLS